MGVIALVSYLIPSNNIIRKIFYFVALSLVFYKIYYKKDWIINKFGKKWCGKVGALEIKKVLRGELFQNPYKIL